MRDKRPVDELSIEELERILAIRKREARLTRIRTHERKLAGRQIMPARQESGDEDSDSFDESVIEPDTAPEMPAVRTAERRSAPPAMTDDEAPIQVTGADPQFEDDLEAALDAPPPGGIDWSRWWNRALTGIEIAAVIGLVLLFVGLFQSFQEITQRTAQVQAEYEATARAAYIPPTPTPVISIGAVVLPTGHTFRDNGEAVFNLDEVPAEYRDQFAAYTASLPAVRPTPSAEGPIRIRIARLNLDSAVVAGDDWEALKLGVGHHLGSANPGARGNSVLAAHNDVYGELFRYLDRLQPGDEIVVSTRTRDYTYVVQPQTERNETKGYRLVLPTDVWVLGPNGDNRQLTLISCYPYRVNSKRIVVFATLRE